MRKPFLSTFLVLLVFCTSCAAQQIAPSGLTAQASTQTETADRTDLSAQMGTSAQVTEITALVEPILIDDIYRFVSDSDIIIIGTVEEALPVVRIDAGSLGLVSGGSAYYENVSSFQVRIEQVIKGDVSAAALLRIDCCGGEAEGIQERYLSVNYPIEGSKYLMFIDKTGATDKTDYFEYRFGVTYDGFSEIIDNKLYPQENTSIFETGMPVEDAVARVTKALEGEPSVETD